MIPSDHWCDGAGLIRGIHDCVGGFFQYPGRLTNLRSHTRTPRLLGAQKS